MRSLPDSVSGNDYVFFNIKLKIITVCVDTINSSVFLSIQCLDFRINGVSRIVQFKNKIRKKKKYSSQVNQAVMTNQFFLFSVPHVSFSTELSPDKQCFIPKTGINSCFPPA